MRMFKILLVFFFACLFPATSDAEFMIGSAIVEFTAEGPRQQDVELISRSKDNDYIETEISEVIHPGQKDESRRIIDDPSQAGLLVTPDKTVLAGGGRKVLRFVLLKDPDTEEHVYRVAVKPVIKGVDNGAKVGLKILVGYEVLVIVRPAHMAPGYTAQRSGKSFKVQNTGNTDILFQSGKQCPTEATCKPVQILRSYPGNNDQIDLPLDMQVRYSIWDGVTASEKLFD